jgi:HlyD family secretion protein
MHSFHLQKTTISSVIGLIHPLIVLPIILLFCFCSSSDLDQSKILYQTTNKNFVLTVNGEGELDAKNSHVLQTPRIWPAPKISFLVAEGTEVKKDDIIVKFEAEQIERDYKNALEEVEIAKAEGKKKNAELELQRLLYESQKNTAEVSASASRLQLSNLEFESPRNKEIKRLEISKQELAAERARKKLTSLEKIQQAERSHAEMRIKQAENKVSRSKMQLDKLILKAPFDGIVVHETNWIKGQKVQEGDALYPGMPVVKLPDLAVMQAELQVGETDAQKVKQGQKVDITVPSIGIGQLLGKVTKVDKIAKPIKRGSKIKKVEVIVEIDSTFARLVPGLTARGNITTGEVDSAIVVPQECIFEKDSIKIVYVFNSSDYDAHAVAISNQSENFYVIVSDLKGDEKLAFRKPPDSRINFPDSLVAPELPKHEDTSVKEDSLMIDKEKMMMMMKNPKLPKANSK